MNQSKQRSIKDLFCLKGKVALVTGGAGELGAVFSHALAEAGAQVWVSDLREERADQVAQEIVKKGFEAKSLYLDVMSRESLEAVASKVGALDILINCAGGNQKEATTSPDLSFFDLPVKSLEKVMALNLFGGAILPSQLLGKTMKDNPEGGVILNVSSMTAIRPLTRIPGYSAAKAAVSNFTQWLAVHLAQEYNPKLRVNALAPGFFLTEQNRYLLVDEKTGELSSRGKTIISHTPVARFGIPEDLAGTVVWLCSDAASFVTGIVVPVDGGFSAFSGV